MKINFKIFGLILVIFTLAINVFLYPQDQEIKPQSIFPLSQIHKGLKGYGLSDFGNGPEKFEFEVVGLVDGSGFYFIEVRLFGGPNDFEGKNIIKEAKVIAGMSGSPIYTEDGLLIGAISSTEALNKEARGQVTPIEYLMNWQPLKAQDRAYIKKFFSSSSLNDLLTAKAIPVLPPGSAYSYSMVWGDDEVAGSMATITSVNPNGTFFAQGHSSYNLGVTGLPVFPAKVIGVNPNLRLSSKIGSTDFNKNIIGTIYFDGQFGHVGMFGVKPKSFPLTVKVTGLVASELVFHDYIACLPPYFMGAVIGDLLSKKASAFDSRSNILLKTRVQIDDLPEIYISERFRESFFGVSSYGVNLVDHFSDALLDKDASLSFEIKAVDKIKNAKITQADIEPVKKNQDLIVRVVLESISENKHWERFITVPYSNFLKDGVIYISGGGEALNKISSLNIGDKSEIIKTVSQFQETGDLYVYLISVETFEFKPGDKDKANPSTDWTKKEIPKRVFALAHINSPEKDYMVSGLIERKLDEPDSEESKNKSKSRLRKLWPF